MEELDQEREGLQKQLRESKEQQSKLQHQLKHVANEKKQLLDESVPQQVLLAQRFNEWCNIWLTVPLLPQVLCTELQSEKARLEAHVDELKSSVGHLTQEVQDLSHRERMLVAFPELSSMHRPQGRVLFIYVLCSTGPRVTLISCTLNKCR